MLKDDIVDNRLKGDVKVYDVDDDIDEIWCDLHKTQRRHMIE